MCTICVHRDQKRSSDPLKLGLQTVVSHRGGAGNLTQVLSRAACSYPLSQPPKQNYTAQCSQALKGRGLRHMLPVERPVCSVKCLVYQAQRLRSRTLVTLPPSHELSGYLGQKAGWWVPGAGWSWSLSWGWMWYWLHNHLHVLSAAAAARLGRLRRLMLCCVHLAWFFKVTPPPQTWVQVSSVYWAGSVCCTWSGL